QSRDCQRPSFNLCRVQHGTVSAIGRGASAAKAVRARNVTTDGALPALPAAPARCGLPRLSCPCGTRATRTSPSYRSPMRHVYLATSLRDDVEVTLEANPEDVTLETATAWCRAGVNRVSLGAQSFDDRVLQWMHRSHDAARIGAAVRTLRGAGIDNISLDLIFALPAELERDWARDLEQALALGPAHLSLYGLTVEDRTPLARWISRCPAAP